MRYLLLTTLCLLLGALAITACSKYDQDQTERLKEKYLQIPVEELITLAKSNDPLAQTYLGMRCMDGNGVAPNREEARKWLIKAADSGEAVAQFYLGHYYYTHGTDRIKHGSDVSRQRMISKVDQDTCCASGIIEDSGHSKDRNFQEAFMWYKKAAEQGNAEACFNLGLSYGRGEGVKRDINQAYRWHLKAARKGYPLAQYLIGCMNDSGTAVEQDLSEAVKWYKRASDRGCKLSSCKLGSCYLKGKGVKQDYAKAFFWYRLAEYSGCKNAEENAIIAGQNLKESHKAKLSLKALKYWEQVK